MYSHALHSQQEVKKQKETSVDKAALVYSFQNTENVAHFLEQEVYSFHSRIVSENDGESKGSYKYTEEKQQVQ